MPAEEKRQWIEPDHPSPSIRRQCELLGLASSTFYYRPRPETPENLALLRKLDELYMEFPFFGSRRMTVQLAVNRKRIQRLMRIAGIEAMYPKPDTSRPGPGHKIHPYLLRDVEITRPDQVWSTDITYIPMRSGFLYIAAVIDWHSRFVLGWELSNTMETAVCLAELGEGVPACGDEGGGDEFGADVALVEVPFVDWDGRECGGWGHPG